MQKKALIENLIQYIKNIPFWSLKSYFWYLSIFTILINWGVYIFFKNIIDNQNDIFLNSYKSSLEKTLEYDINFIERLEAEKKQIFILQSIESKISEKRLEALMPIANSKFLYYEENIDSVYIDIQKLKEIIDEIIPSALKYQILFNAVIINPTQAQDSFNLINNYEIGKKLKINLSLNEQSFLLITSNNNLITMLIIDAIISIVFVTVIISIFYKRQKQFNNIIINQKHLLCIANKSIKDMQEGHLAKKEIDSYFVKKATEIYTKHELSEIENNNELKQIILKNIGIKDYIFPLLLKGISKSTIKVDNFFVNLEKSLISHMFKSKVLLNVATKHLNIKCDKEVFYQIIYSLTSNIMMFLENQSDEIKQVDIEVLENKITYIYKGYPLSRDNIIKLSNHMSPWTGDTFLLTGEKLFQSIDYHNMIYNFNSSGFKNKIELLFCEKKR